MAVGKKPDPADPAKKANDDDHYENLPDMRSPAKSPPKTIVNQASNYAGSLWSKVSGWFSPPATSPAASPAPPPPVAPVEPPPLNIRLPEDTKTKVKWNNKNYQTLSGLPPPELVFPDKTPPTGPVKTTSAEKSSPTSDSNKTSETSSESNSMQYF